MRVSLQFVVTIIWYNWVIFIIVCN